MKFATAKSAKNASNSWTLRLFTLLIWLFVGLCAAYWAFKFVTTKPVEATAALAAPTMVVDSKAIGKLLGATDNVAVKAVNTAASTKFVLFGLANSAGGQGVALIALDGKPAKPYRVGSLVADDLLLKSISKTGVMLATSLKSPDGVTLELPERNPAVLVPIQPRPFTNAANPNGAAPATNTAAVPPQVPFVPTKSPNDILPSVSATAGAAGLNDRAAAISRFAPRPAADGSASFPDMPAKATSSAVGER